MYTSWREVFTEPGYWKWLLVAQVVRLSTYLTTFAYLLAASDYLDRPSLGGLMIAGGTTAAIVMAPVNGRLFDRFGVSRLLPLQQFAGGLMMALLLLLIWQRAPTPIIVAGCVLLGCLTSASGGAMRSLLNAMIPASLVNRAVAIDSLILELTVIAAPLIVVAITWFGSLGGVVTMLGAFAISAVLTWRVLPSGVVVSHATPSAQGDRILRNRPFAFWCVVSLALGTSIGIVEVGAIDISHRSGGGSFQAALLIVVICSSSILTGLAWGTWSHRIRWPMLSFGVGFMAITLAAQLAVILAENWLLLTLLYAILGATIAPSSILRQQATDALTSPSQRAQAFATIFAANALGFALAGLLHSLFSLEQAILAASIPPTLAIGLAFVAARGSLGSQMKLAAAPNRAG